MKKPLSIDFSGTFRFERILLFLFLALLLAGLPGTAQGQCKAFARRICKTDLDRFTHDGNYHAAVITQGEEAELYKTFYANQTYRITVCGSDELSEIEFRVMDNQRNVLYDNRSRNYSRTWDFRLDSSQQLMVLVAVPSARSGSEPQSGCVAILFGVSER
jgi:hypothetical protein